MNAVDLFCGSGGMSEGLRQAGFKLVAGVEIDALAAQTYARNHGAKKIINEDIRKLNPEMIIKRLKKQPLHLLVGCPPCQGFSRMRRLNRNTIASDDRNTLLLEYYRFVEELEPYTIMLENVPQLEHYPLFKDVVNKLSVLGYNIKYATFDVSSFGVPQRRKRVVLIGSRLGEIDLTPAPNIAKHVRDYISHLPLPQNSTDRLHNRFPKHGEKISKLIELLPKDGGSLHSLPAEFQLRCHAKENVGFNDVYGRLKWDKVSSTITGGCLNPSKGRFIHPEQNRCITAREAALLQTFPNDYYFPAEESLQKVALLIGNAVPPRFAYYHANHIKQHINKYLSLN